MALLAVRAALGAHPHDNPLAQEVMQALEAGDWHGARTRRAAIEAIAARLDQDYLEVYGAEGDQNTPRVIEAFSRARAVESLAMALEPDETMAAKESLYEAYAALDEVRGDALLAAVRRVLGTA